MAAEDMQGQRTAARDYNMKFMLFSMEAVMLDRSRGGSRVRLFVQHWLKQKSDSNGTRIRLAFTGGWRFKCFVCAGRRMASTAICCEVMVASRARAL